MSDIGLSAPTFNGRSMGFTDTYIVKHSGGFNPLVGNRESETMGYGKSFVGHRTAMGHINMPQGRSCGIISIYNFLIVHKRGWGYDHSIIVFHPWISGASPS